MLIAQPLACAYPHADRPAERVSSAKNLPPLERQFLAVEALSGKTPVSRLAASVGVSRKFVYQQSEKANNALDEAFANERHDDEVLFYLPVTRKWIRQFILGLLLIGHSSFRGVIELLRDFFDVGASIGTVHNVVREAVQNVRHLQTTETLAPVTVGAHDEIFQGQSPVLVGADVFSTYCYLLSPEKSRDADTWAIRLMELSDKGMHPEHTIADGGKGLRAGQALAWPGVPCNGDVFHALLDTGRLSTYLENRALGALSEEQALSGKMARAKNKGQGNKFSKRLALASQNAAVAINLADDIATLQAWLRDDILALSALDLASRRELLAFVIEALRERETLAPHRIKPVRTLLENQCEELLAFAAKTGPKLAELAAEINLPVELLRERFDAIANDPESDEDAITGSAQNSFGLLFPPAESALRLIRSRVVRASSIIENINGRLRNYFFLRRQIGPEYLDLLRFFLNHRRFMRSEHPGRVGKSPAELLFGTSHPHWIEMLGYQRFKHAA